MEINFLPKKFCFCLSLETGGKYIGRAGLIGHFMCVIASVVAYIYLLLKPAYVMRNFNIPSSSLYKRN
jgi:hypothetical protein